MTTRGYHLKTRWLVVVLALLCWSAPLRADEVDRAKELFRQAEVHFKLGEFDQALPLYKQAYREKPLPAMLFNIAQCHRFLKQYERCAFFFERFLLEVPDTPHRENVLEMIEQCKKAEAGGTQPPATQPTSAPTTQQVKPPPPPPPFDPSRRRTRRALLWTGVGLSVALLATGTVTGVLAYDKSKRYNDTTTGDDYKTLVDLRNSGKTLATVSVVTLSAGGLAAAGTLLFYFLYDEAPQTAPRVSLVPKAEGGATLLLQGRF
jgi:tetratricopeptide (TPR) repeat protein